MRPRPNVVETIVPEGRNFSLTGPCCQRTRRLFEDSKFFSPGFREAHTRPSASWMSPKFEGGWFMKPLRRWVAPFQPFSTVIYWCRHPLLNSRQMLIRAENLIVITFWDIFTRQHREVSSLIGTASWPKNQNVSLVQQWQRILHCVILQARWSSNYSELNEVRCNVTIGIHSANKITNSCTRFITIF